MNTPRLVVAGLLAILVGTSGAAHGAQIVVTMKDDVVADDGRCSLREAIGAANTGLPSGGQPGECIAGQRVPVVDVILLRRGIYRLKRGAAGDDLNLGGDLDVTESVVIQGKGQKGTVIQNGIGAPDVAGDGDRLFHVDPGAAGGVDVTFSKLTLARGDVSCTGNECDSGASAVDARGSGALTFESCLVMRNDATCFGDGCGTRVSGAAIASIDGGAITIRDTTIKKNSTRCVTRGCGLGAAAVVQAIDGGVALFGPLLEEDRGDFTLDGSTITQNTSQCAGTACGAGGIVGAHAGSAAVRRVEVSLNTVQCTGDDCGTYGVLGIYGAVSAAVEDVELAGNLLGCAGVDCYLDGTLYVASSGAASVRGATLRGNPASCAGASCWVGSSYSVQGTTGARAEGLEVRDSTITCSGEGCEIEPVLQVVADGPVDVADVAAFGHEIGCEQAFCRVAGIAAWRGAPVRTLRTDISANESGCSGDDCRVRTLLEIEAAGDSTVDGQQLSGNDAVCSGRLCATADMVEIVVADGGLTIAAPIFEANELRCEGEGCAAADFLDVSVTGDVEIGTPAIASNLVRCDGAGCVAGGTCALQSDRLDFTDAVVLDNASQCAGDGCRGTAVVRFLAADAGVARSRFTENRVSCDGADCAAGPGGAVRNQASRLHVTSSELSANQTDGLGAAIFNDAGSELILEQVSMLRNEAGLRGVMALGGLGGAIYNDASNGARGELTLIDTEIRRNRALRNGGGILNEGIIARLVNFALEGNDPTDCFDLGGNGCP